MFETMDDRVLKKLQSVLDEQGLNDPNGVKRLAKLDPSSVEFMALVEKLQGTGMDPDEAKAQLLKWQSAQEQLEEKIMQLKSQTVGARPLWRCAVCGQANKPWIACYVAPYVCGYEKVLNP